MEYHVFKHPYILIEDLTGKYKPFHREYSGESKETMIPVLELDSAPSQKKARPAKKAGVCELCVTKYSDYEEHVQLPKHAQAEKSHIHGYSEIDIISELLKKKKEKRGPKKRLFAW
ncbi:uncharacterized protein NEMAJ01_2254 [Nematocida major]|uniref:uncharacterized protein n=1 Tax=Nematocida major TaxID=1912982 RepID=UPI002008E290|nr:uncharacterized protein NEMAJ01_2254 [Nematocida major]KAH9387358.1 hypothetical protein NEMAJ01_2254 [Nematocida major]